jgi:non-ribosomal peptide synthetase component F
VTPAHEFGARRAVTSAAQDGLWFVDTCVHDAPTYQVCRAYRVRGELHVDSLRAAWSGLVARHESLRTTLVSREGRPLQLIAGERADVPSFDDLGAVPALSGDFKARRWCADLAATPLDLAAGPLARLVVARVSASEHLVVLLLHQAVTDEESTSILIEELSGAYSAELAGRTARDLPAPRAQYADFARWQRRRTASGRFHALVDWWTDTLSPVPPQLTLPVDRARPAAPSGQGGLVAFDWGERIAEPLARLCGTSRTTPFAALLTAFQALLHRYGGEERIAVAVPVPIRSRPEFARIVGACREPVVVCADVSSRPSFRELLGRVTVTAEDALRHRGLPFDQLVRALNPDRDFQVAPLSDAAFVFRQDPEAALDLVGTLVRPLLLDSTVVRADLTFTVDRIDRTVAGSLAFRTSMFERTSAQRILDQLRTLLAGALADPDQPVDALPLDEPRRTRAAVRDADWIDVGEPVRLTVPEQVHRIAAQQPDATAVVLGEESLTYRQLVDQAAALTAALRAGNGVAGRAVAVRIPIGPRQVVALLGVLDAGAYLVSIGTGDNGQRGRAVLADLRPVRLVLDGAPDSYDLIDWYRDELDGQIIDLAELSPPTEVATGRGPATELAGGLGPATEVATELAGGFGPATEVATELGPATEVATELGPATELAAEFAPATGLATAAGLGNSNSNVGVGRSTEVAAGLARATEDATGFGPVAELATSAGLGDSNCNVGVGQSGEATARLAPAAELATGLAPATEAVTWGGLGDSNSNVGVGRSSEVAAGLARATEDATGFGPVAGLATSAGLGDSNSNVGVGRSSEVAAGLARATEDATGFGPVAELATSAGLGNSNCNVGVGQLGEVVAGPGPAAELATGLAPTTEVATSAGLGDSNSNVGVGRSTEATAGLARATEGAAGFVPAAGLATSAGLGDSNSNVGVGRSGEVATGLAPAAELAIEFIPATGLATAAGLGNSNVGVGQSDEATARLVPAAELATGLAPATEAVASGGLGDSNCNVGVGRSGEVAAGLARATEGASGFAPAVEFATGFVPAAGVGTSAGFGDSNSNVGVGRSSPTPTLELAGQVQLQRCGWLDERAYVAYTSGSTGRPKGIAQTHRGFAQFIGWWSGEFVAGPSARVAQWAASGYDASLVEIFGALVVGATVYQVPERIRANPEKIVDWLAAERITVLQTVPSFAREVGRAITAAGAAASLTSVDHLLLAGEALPGELAGALRSVLPGARLVNLYGPTESILATWHEVTGPVRGPVPIGRPIPGRQVLVLDAEDRPCAAGTVGQVVIRSPYIVPGYVGAAAPERSAFRPVAGLDEYGDGTCYRTGDFARRRWDGLLEFRGRGDFQVKFHGTRVELTDVEATLLTHESVADCAVIGVPNADGLVTRLVAYVVPRRAADGRAVAGADVWRAHLRGWFGRSKLPVSFKTVIGLPRNLGGKVDRQRLPDPGPSTVVANRPPMTPVERVMNTIWAELVGVAPDSVDDSFFAAGGHSLLVPQLLDRIRDRFGVAVSVREYMPNPTVAGLSGLVDGKLVSAMSVTDKVMGEKT